MRFLTVIVMRHEEWIRYDMNTCNIAEIVKMVVFAFLQLIRHTCMQEYIENG